MVLIVDDNTTIANNIIDELSLDDVEATAVHKVDDFLALIESDDFSNYTTIIMDYNLEDRMNGIQLLEILLEKVSYKCTKKIYLFSGNISYITQDETNFLEKNMIKAMCKTQQESLIEEIIA